MGGDVASRHLKHPLRLAFEAREENGWRGGGDMAMWCQLNTPLTCIRSEGRGGGGEQDHNLIKVVNITF
jgi:hypothetical protein